MMAENMSCHASPYLLRSFWWSLGNFISGECFVCCFLFNGTIHFSVVYWWLEWVILFGWFVSCSRFDNGTVFGGIIYSTVRKLLVPLSERRHRLYKHEIPEVVSALKSHLIKLVEDQEKEEKAEIVFRALFRLTEAKPGRPKYPKFSWGQAQYYIDFGWTE